MTLYWKSGLAAVAAASLWLSPSIAWANVYASGVTIDATTLDSTCGTLSLSYILNENANGDGVRPGVKIEVLDQNGTPVRTETIARQTRGRHAWQWDGRKDDGTPAPNGSYSIRITAADVGHNQWTQISALDTAHSFWYPRSVDVNTNPASPHYGTTYVGENNLATPGATAFGRTTQDGIYALTADGAEAGFGAGGGYDWAADGSNYSAPYKLSVGEDDHVYVASFYDDVTFDFLPDLSSATQLTTTAVNNSNYGGTTAQWISAILATGSQIGGDRVLYLNNPNYNAAAPNRRGVIKYDLFGNPTAASAGLGTYFIDQYQGGSGFYGYDIARDAEGNFYITNYRAKAGEAEAIEKYDANGARVESFSTPDDQLLIRGIGVSDAKGWVAIGKQGDGTVQIYDKATGAHVVGVPVETATRNIWDVAFDAVGNMYTVCNQSEWLRTWSPPDGPNHNEFTTASFTLNKAGAGGPVITAQPQDMALCPGDNGVFTVAATGSNPTFQWQKNGVDLVDGGNVSGSNTNTLTLSNVGMSDNGATITVRICDDNGVVVSNIAQIFVGVYIQQPPASTTACEGSDATFTVLATGKGQLSYQWERDFAGDGNFSPILGATSNSVTLTNVQTGLSGSQVRCIITDECNSPVTSPAAILTVRGAPTGVLVYFPVTVEAGTNAHFFAQATGTGTLHYQWYKTVNGVKTPIGTDAPTLDYIAQKCDNWIENGEVQPAVISCAITDDCGTTEGNSNVGTLCTLTVSPGGPVPEVCDNGVDDDCDNIIDCEDEDCALQCCNEPFADVEGNGEYGPGKGDGDVDQEDFAYFQLCLTGASGAVPSAPPLEFCYCFDRVDTNGQAGEDGHITSTDLVEFEKCATGPAIPWTPTAECP